MHDINFVSNNIIIVIVIVRSPTSEVRDSVACCAEAAEASSRARMEAEARSRGVGFMALVRLL